MRPSATSTASRSALACAPSSAASFAVGSAAACRLAKLRRRCAERARLTTITRVRIRAGGVRQRCDPAVEPGVGLLDDILGRGAVPEEELRQTDHRLVPAAEGPGQQVQRIRGVAWLARVAAAPDPG